MRARTLLFASIALAFALLAVRPAASQSHGVLGLWREPGGSIINVHPCGPDLCAQLVYIAPNAPISTDAKNPDPTQRARALCGLQIGWGFHRDGPDQAIGGTIYDPRDGTSYHATLTAQGNTLHFRHNAWWHVLDAVEDWTRVNQPIPPCQQ